MNARILETIKKSAAVPSMPQVVMRFLEIMQDPEFSYQDLEKVMATDPGTVSEVLRLANSALFGVRNKVVSIRQALTLLGPKRVRSLLLGRYLVDTMSHRRVPGLDMTYFWRRSLAASVLASHCAEKVLPKHRDEAFIGALLAKIGIPILAEALPQRYGWIAGHFTPNGTPFTIEQELEAVAVTHAEVSAMVLGHWTLPENVTHAVNCHLSDNPGDGTVPALARILRSADRISWILCEVCNAAEIVTVCAEATGSVGIDLRVLTKILPTVERDIEELAQALRIDVVPTNVYAIVAKTVQDAIAIPITA
jgi:HD-like signal output (HDOD) protein